MSARETVLDLKARMAQSIIGQEAVVDRLMLTLLCNGNVLVEGLPGLAKTRAIKTLSTCLESTFQRIQFTPDLLPSDVTGAEVYYSEGGRGEFKFQPWPIFGNLILADEMSQPWERHRLICVQVSDSFDKLQHLLCRMKKWPIATSCGWPFSMII